MNKKHKRVGEHDYKEVPVSKKDLLKARKEASKLMIKDPTKLTWRSCWVCNGAHLHFLDGEWGNWVLHCIGCGNWYYDKINITVLKESVK